MKWGGEPAAWGGDPDTRWGYPPLPIRVRLEGREPVRSLTGSEPSGELVGAAAATTYSGKEPGT
jgi:hypothetical protein